MALPPVDGWLIDFRTARAIFDSQNNERIAHCVDLCEAEQLHICHCEEGLFRGSDGLCDPFINARNCVWEPDDDIFERCATLAAHPLQKQALQGNDAAIFLTATALAKNFGVISDHRSIVFATVFDLCQNYGVPALSADEYFQLAL